LLPPGILNGRPDSVFETTPAGFAGKPDENQKTKTARLWKAGEGKHRIALSLPFPCLFFNMSGIRAFQL